MIPAGERKIRTLVVDDEPPARRNLRALLKGDPEIDVVKECGNGREAVQQIRSLQPDLVFLDIQMPELNGFEVLEHLAGHPLPIIVFVTAYDQYALRAFEVSALDYLLKPFSDERFHKALAQAKRQFAQQGTSEIGQKLLALMGAREAPRSHLTRLMVKSGGRVLLLRAEDISWIEACDNYVRLHVGGKAHLLRQTMSELEAVLDPARFARIHRSTIVNLDCIAEMHPHFNGEYRVLLQDGTELKMSRNRRDALEQRMNPGLR